MVFTFFVFSFFFSRAEELETALMEMVKQDNRRQLSARVYPYLHGLSRYAFLFVNRYVAIATLYLPAIVQNGCVLKLFVCMLACVNQ